MTANAHARLRALAALAACWTCLAPAQPVAGGPAITSTRIGGPANVWTPGRIEVFATSAMFVANAQRAEVYRVDAQEQLEAELNQGDLPPDPQQALAIVRQRIRAMDPPLQQRVQAALRATQAVMVYGVQQLPAIVFDGSRVVYGVADVAQAIDIVRRGGGQPISAQFVPGGPAAAPAQRAVP